MKLGKLTLLATTYFISYGANAAVDVTFSPDVETVVVNGKKTLNLLESTEELKLDNGLNQVVVRVSKLVEGQGQLEKYRSEPIVITFNASDTKFNISPKNRIINAVDVSNFDANPSMKIDNYDNFKVNATIDVLPKNNSGDSGTIWGRDYLKDLAYYNQSKGYIFEGQEPIIDQDKKPMKLVKLENNNSSKAQQYSDNEIKKIFQKMDQKQRKDFLMWAVSQ